MRDADGPETRDQRRGTRDEGRGYSQLQMHVIAVMWISITILVIAFIIWLCWPMICQRAAITALEQAFGQAVTSRTQPQSKAEYRVEQPPRKFRIRDIKKVPAVSEQRQGKIDHIVTYSFSDGLAHDVRIEQDTIDEESIIKAIKDRH